MVQSQVVVTTAAGATLQQILAMFPQCKNATLQYDTAFVGPVKSLKAGA